MRILIAFVLAALAGTSRGGARRSYAMLAAKKADMKKILNNSLTTAASLIAAGSLVACASAPPEPTVLLVGKDDFKVFGTSVHTTTELGKLLVEHKVAKVEIRPDADIGNYEQIGKAIYTVYRSGGEVARVVGADKI